MQHHQHQQQLLQQALLHPPLWLPRFVHLFTWDDSLLGGGDPLAQDGGGAGP